MAKYLSGPWRTDINDDGELIVIMRENPRIEAWYGDAENTSGEIHASAELAAAAPELIDALANLTSGVRALVEALTQRESVSGDTLGLIVAASIANQYMGAIELLERLGVLEHED